MKPRLLTPELLDDLPPDDPAAQHSRRDLWRLNHLMRHRRTWTKWWRCFFPQPPALAAELGAGDARVLAAVLRDAYPAGGHGARLVLVDRSPCVAAETLDDLARAGWQVESAAADVFDWLVHAPVQDLISANLFLHHFAQADLARLLAACAQKCRTFLALEPRRGAMGLAACAALPLIGCNAVTRHDARVSVEAGFTGAELTALWPQHGWSVAEHRHFPFGHTFTARRST